MPAQLGAGVVGCLVDGDLLEPGIGVDVEQAQAEAARITLEADARRIAVEIGSRVLSRPLTNADLN